jgi:hypothetical protein
MPADLLSVCVNRWVAVSLLVLLSCLPTPACADELVFGYVPDRCQLLSTPEKADAFIAYLSAKLGQPIRARVFNDEQKLQHWLNLFREVDLAVISQVYITENGKGVFIPLVEYLLESSNNLGLGMVVGRRGLQASVFFNVKQILLAAASDPGAADMLDTLDVAGFVIPRQPQVDYAKPFRVPPRPCIPDPLKAEPVVPQPLIVIPPAPVSVASVPSVAPSPAERLPVQVDILSPRNDGMTGPQPLLQYVLKNARARVYLDGKALNKGPGDRLGPLSDGRHELIFEISSPLHEVMTERINFQVDATPPDLSIEEPFKVVSTSSASVGGRRELDTAVVVLNDSGQEVGSVSFPDAASWQVQLSKLQAGENRFQVVGRDRYGNQQRQSFVLVLDLQPPRVAILDPVDGAIISSAPVLAFSAEEGSVSVLVDGEPVDDVNPLLESLDDGDHVIVVRVQDAAGRVGEATSRFQLDRSGPELTVEPVAAVLGQRQITLRGTRESDSNLALSLEPTSLSAQLDYPSATSWKVDLEGLVEGQNVVALQARDLAGNLTRQRVTLTVDLTAPVVSISSPVTGSVHSVSPIFDYQTDAESVLVQLDGKELTLLPGASLPALTEGEHTLMVTATDIAGNTGLERSTFTIDSSGPTVVLEQPGSLVSEADPVISFVADEGQVRVLLDGNPITIESDDRLPTLADGEHRLRVEAVDAAGNQGFAERVFVVDTTRPVLTVSSAPALVKGDQAILEGSADPDALLTASLQGREFPVERLADGGWRITMDQLADGTNPVLISAIDPAGLTTVLTIDVVRDTTPPELTVTTPQPGQVYNQLPKLVFSSGEGAVVVRLDAVAIELGNDQFLPEMADGDHQLELEVTDAAGNQVTRLIAFHLDRQGPDLTVEPFPNAFNGEFLLLQGKTEPEVSIRVATQKHEDACLAEAGASGAWSCTIGPFEEGPLEMTVVATDPIGNQSRQVLSITIDRTPPRLEWRAPLAGVYQTVDSFDYTLSDGNLEILIDDQPHDPLAPIPELSEGTHQIAIRTFDEAGNQSQTLIALTIDRQAPLVVISQPEPLVTDAQPVLSFIADSRRVTVYLDGKEIEIAAGDRLPVVDDGEHTLRIEAVDDAGLVGVAERVFRVDTVRPELTLAGEPGPVSDEDVVLTGFTEAEATLSADYSGSSLVVERPTPESWSVQVAGLKEGTNQIIIIATDPGGLQSALNVQIVRDSQAPPLVLVSPLAQTYRSDRPRLDYQIDAPPARLEVYLDDTLVEVDEDRLLGPLRDGEHHLLVKAWDAAGNLSQVVQHFYIDTTAPVFFIDPLPAVVPSASVRLSGTREPGSFIDVFPPAETTISIPRYPAENLWEIDLTNVPDGEHELHFSARDQYGNTGHQQMTLTVDSQAPRVRILSPVASLMNDPQPELRFEGEGGAVRIQLNGEEVSLLTDRIGPLEDGEYTLLVTETDEAGNLGQSRVVFQVDTTPPQIDLISPAKGDRTSTNPTLAYRVTEGLVRIQLDGRAIEVASGQSLPQLSEGEHTVRLTATDNAGNVAMAQAIFTVDGSAPQVVVLSPASGLTPDTTPYLQFRVDRGEVRILVDGVEVDKRSGTSLDPLAEGEHLVRVEARDKNGNVGFAERLLVVSMAQPLKDTTTELADRFAKFSFEVVPEEVSTSYAGDVELRIGPLRTPGETVYIEQWIDANGNGVADSGEQVAKIFKLVDGLSSPSPKVPGDLDGLANRIILFRLPLDQLHQRSQGSVRYVLLAMGDSDVAETRFRVVSEQ